jgi:predicted metal-dependent hydrolase
MRRTDPARAIATETQESLRLPGGPLAYTLRRSPRARTLRVLIHPERGVVVTIPATTGHGPAFPHRHIEGFLRAREPWLRRHLAQHEIDRAELAARGGLADGATLRVRGELHRLRLVDAGDGARRSSVERIGGEDDDELVVRRSSGDGRPTAAILEAWFRSLARTAIDREVERHARALRVTPTSVTVRDQRTRWGSASRHGRLSLSWRLILAPPEALETVVIHELAHLRVFGHGPAFWDLVASRRPDHVTWRRWLRAHSHELHRALVDP